VMDLKEVDHWDGWTKQEQAEEGTKGRWRAL
jgi:hypothetical protein